MGVIRTKITEITFPLHGGKVTARPLTNSERRELREKHATTKEDGRVVYDFEAIGVETFKKVFVRMEGFKDEDKKDLKLTDELKDEIVEFDPVFFDDFMTEFRRRYKQRKDIAEKN